MAQEARCNLHNMVYPNPTRIYAHIVKKVHGQFCDNRGIIRDVAVRDSTALGACGTMFVYILTKRSGKYVVSRVAESVPRAQNAPRSRGGLPELAIPSIHEKCATALRIHS